MYQYPSFSMNNYQPAQQSMYQPMQNPYMDRMANLQSAQTNYRQTQVPFQTMILNGRIVEDFGMISANDVPMDNFGAVFMKRDCSELQHKIWTSDGKILTTSYKPILDTENEHAEEFSPEEPKVDFGAFESVLKGLSDKIDSLSDKMEDVLKQKTSSKSKKEVE